MVKNEQEISKHFGIFISKFILLYPELKNRPIFLTGESYAGHYIPFMANYINK